MAFTAALSTHDSTATITLTGELDASSAPTFREQVDRAAGQSLKRLVLMVQDLEYIASAGLRVLIFAKQKMGAQVDIYVVGAQQQVIDTLQKTGFHQSVILRDSYPAGGAGNA